MKHNGRGGSWIFSTLFLIVMAAAAYLLVVNRQQVLDDVALWNYKPSTQIAAIADRTTMTDQARRIFYASHPELDDAATFNQACGQSEQGSAILGCYTGLKIYIYNVADPRLDGIHEVTAAHEMLHAAYQRMSASEKSTVDALLEKEYAKLQKDPDFADRMALYARTEPGQRDNELHSIIGTEVASLDPALEAHYAQYFTNRAAVVALHDHYASIFTNLHDQAAQLSTQMQQLQQSITTKSNQYASDSQQLSSDIAAFNQRANSGGFSSSAQFASDRQSLLARVDQLNATRTDINNMIAQYDDLVKQYNAIATQTNQLNQSLSSNLAPAPSL